MNQPGWLSGSRVEVRKVWPLAGVAEEAGQREIIQCRGASMFLWDAVVKLKNTRLQDSGDWQ